MYNKYLDAMLGLGKYRWSKSVIFAGPHNFMRQLVQ